MPFTVRDINTAIFHVVDKAVFFIDPATIFALQITGERLWFSDTVPTAVSLNVFDKLVDSF